MIKKLNEKITAVVDLITEPFHVFVVIVWELLFLILMLAITPFVIVLVLFTGKGASYNAMLETYSKYYDERLEK